MAFTRMEIRHDLENSTVNDALWDDGNYWDDSILDDYLDIDDGHVEDEYLEEDF